MFNDLQNPELVYSLWADAEDIELETLRSLFLTAFEIVEAFAPSLKGAPAPERYKLAEIMQAKDIWSKFSGGNRDEVGPDTFSTAVYPLVFAARDLLRPKRNPLGRLGA